MTRGDHTLSTINALKRRLEALESEKRELLAELARLQRVAQAPGQATTPSAAAPAVSAAADRTRRPRSSSSDLYFAAERTCFLGGGRTRKRGSNDMDSPCSYGIGCARLRRC